MPFSNSLPAGHTEPPRFSEDIDSTCSTPFVSAPSSPAHGPSPSAGYFFSAPASPMHFLHSSQQTKLSPSDSGSFEFEFSSRFSPNGSMTSADELFFNGQIRPMKLSSHLQRPQADIVAQFVDLDIEDQNVRGRDPRGRNGKYSHHRKARSLSPLHDAGKRKWLMSQESEKREIQSSSETTPSCSASSSRSSSSGRNPMKWIFLKDLLHRSRSEGRADNKERFWSGISFSPVKERSPAPVLSPSSSRDEKKGKGEVKKKARKSSAAGNPANGVWRRRAPASAHELHYASYRAKTEEMRKKTFLPYRQGILGCLGFGSKSYGAFNGFTKNLNPN